MAYSTCTFNELENERTIEGLLQRYPQLQLKRMERIWPHLQPGEGHFCLALGWGKQKGHQLKNHYPKGLRR